MTSPPKSLADALADALANALADRYELLRELGQGGMATVYLAEDVKHRRKVALKVLRPELSAVIGADRFLKEIETTANLQHSHILPLHDSGEVHGTVFYVMPFVDGETLRDRLNREKQLPVDDAVRLTSEIASALDYAHRKGVIHRDIKPENILLHEGQAVVADFGIALAAATTVGRRMTETGMSLGTPHYMSPEQAMGERAYVTAYASADTPASHSGARAAATWKRITIAVQPAFAVRERKKLFTLPADVRPSRSSARFDVAPGDQRFLMIRTIANASGASGGQRVVLVTNFLEELKTKAGARQCVARLIVVVDRRRQLDLDRGCGSWTSNAARVGQGRPGL